MKRILYIVLTLVALASCQQHIQLGEQGSVLELDVVRAETPVVVSRAIDADLAITILDANGREYLHYPAGTVPNRIVLEPGTFTVCAYTENQDTWHTANEGKGEPCCYASRQIVMEYDHFVRLSMSVPMTNYAVGLQLPEKFDELFNAHQLTLQSGSREVIILEGENAYFSVSDGGFTHVLSAINTDGITHSYSPKSFDDVQSGKCYLLNYSYGFDNASQAVQVEVFEKTMKE